MTESRLSNACYAIGDSYGGKGGTSRESINSNLFYAIGDDCVLTTSNKLIGSCFYNRIAMITTIVYGVITLNYHSNK